MIWMRLLWWIFWRMFIAGLVVSVSSSCLLLNLMSRPGIYTLIIGTFIYIPSGIAFATAVSLLTALSLVMLIRVLLVLRRGRRHFRRNILLMAVFSVNIAGLGVAGVEIRGSSYFIGDLLLYLPAIIIMTGVTLLVIMDFPSFATPLLVQRRARLHTRNVLL